ncbi:radical SAM protein [Paenibacillus campinasensis]|uniref:radical SAM protein n=1 Tax=Paenibacillus campinasensis TaxID=66347 RepID=UPI002E7B286E|nr:radical SAM protein [Paenibacillus campinasensis]
MGGEPLLQWDLLSVILAEARQLGYRNIFIYTNLMDVGELNWEELSGASLVIHASSHNQDLTNRMIENRPDFSNFYENMNKLRKTGIPFCFNVVLNK